MGKKKKKEERNFFFFLNQGMQCRNATLTDYT